MLLGLFGMTTDLLFVKKGPGQVKHDTAMCHCQKEGQRPCGLHQEEDWQALSTSHPSHLLSTGDTLYWRAVLVCTVQDNLLCDTQGKNESQWAQPETGNGI